MRRSAWPGIRSEPKAERGGARCRRAAPERKMSREPEMRVGKGWRTGGLEAMEGHEGRRV